VQVGTGELGTPNDDVNLRRWGKRRKPWTGRGGKGGQHVRNIPNSRGGVHRKGVPEGLPLKESAGASQAVRGNDLKDWGGKKTTGLQTGPAGNLPCSGKQNWSGQKKRKNLPRGDLLEFNLRGKGKPKRTEKTPARLAKSNCSDQAGLYQSANKKKKPGVGGGKIGTVLFTKGSQGLRRFLTKVKKPVDLKRHGQEKNAPGGGRLRKLGLEGGGLANGGKGGVRGERRELRAG